MRNLYCPICADEIRWHGSEFHCDGGARLSPKLGNAIKHAVFRLPAPAGDPREPALAPYLWCPNCTAELEEYNERQNRLRCAACTFELPATFYFELTQIKGYHRDPTVEEDW